MEKSILVKKKSPEFLGVQYLGSGKILKSAVNKYGVEAFIVEVIEWCDSKQSLDIREKYWISYYKSFDNSIGYNIAKGGEGGDTWSNRSVADKQKTIDKLKKENTGKVTIIKDNVVKKIHRNTLDTYLKDGWSIYHWKRSSEQQEKWLKSIKNLMWITDGKVNKRVISCSAWQEKYKGFWKGFTHHVKSKEQIIEQQRLKREQIEKEFFKSDHFCECCGKLITQYIGSGRFCSRSCASTHKHSEETRKKLSELNKLGICGNKGKHWSEEIRQKHSASAKRYFENQIEPSIWINNGIETKRIPKSALPQWQIKGWGLGRGQWVKSAWNKGLSKEDPRVNKNSNNRIQTMLQKYKTLNVYKIKEMKSKEGNKK